MTQIAVHIRPARRDTAPEIAAILRESFDDAMPRLAGLHTPDEDLAFVREALLPTCAVVIVESGHGPVGFAAVKAGWIEQFYLRPGFQRRGIGTALLEAIRHGHEQLQLWTFQENSGARAFYRRHGFDEVEFTDGSGNEEKAPDVRMIWRRA